MEAQAANDLDRRLAEDIERALASGDRATAYRKLDGALRADRSNDDLTLTAALMHLEDGHAPQAAEFALATLAARPFHPAAMNVLGVACLDAGLFDVAARVLAQAVDLAPGLASTKHNLELARLADADARLGLETTPRDGARETQTLRRTVLAATEFSSAPCLGVTILLRDGQTSALATCLESIPRGVTEIVVVDARSEASSALPYCSDMRTVRTCPDASRAAQRNSGLRSLGTDWALILDANEAVVPGCDAALADAMRHADTLGHLVVLRSATGGSARRALRLVRNAPGLRFREGHDDDLLPSVHTLSCEWGLGLGAVPLAIECGNASPVEATSPAARAALEAEIGDADHAGFALTALAAQALKDGATAEALERAQAARRWWETLPGPRRAVELQTVTTIEGRCLMLLERHAELQALLAAHHARFPASASTLFLDGLAAKATGDPRRAAGALREALNRKGAPSFEEPIPEVAGPKLPNLLGATLLDTADLDGATEAFQAALADAPENLDARLGLLGIDHARGHVDKMLRELDQLTGRHGDDLKLWLAGAIVLGRVPALGGTAVAWLDEARRRFPGHKEISRRLGEALLQSGIAEKAARVLGDLPQDTCEVTAAKLAASLACGGELPSCRASDAEKLSTLVLGWFHRWAAFGALESLDRALLDIARVDPHLPGLGARTAAWLETIGQHEAADAVRQKI